MSVRVLCFATLLLSALGLGPGMAHLLEMPVKLGYTPEQYFAVTSTLYAYFGLAGAAFQVGALVAACALAWLTRHDPAARLTLVAAVLLGLSLATWALAVAPVNAQWSEAIAAGSDSLPELYADLRWRWEAGHLAAFGWWLLGYGCLLWFAIPARSRGPREDA